MVPGPLVGLHGIVRVSLLPAHALVPQCQHSIEFGAGRFGHVHVSVNGGWGWGIVLDKSGETLHCRGIVVVGSLRRGGAAGQAIGMVASAVDAIADPGVE